MKQRTKRIMTAVMCAALLTTGTYLPQISAAIPQVQAAEMSETEDRVLLKTISGITLDQWRSGSVTVTAEDLNIGSYRQIYAKVQFVPVPVPAQENVLYPEQVDFLVGTPDIGDVGYAGALKNECTDFVMLYDRDALHGEDYQSFGASPTDEMTIQLTFGTAAESGKTLSPGSCILELYGANDPDSYAYPAQTKLAEHEKTLLKEYSGSIEQMQTDPAFRLERADLNGETYDAIYAEVYFQPAESSEVPSGSYRYASEVRLTSEITQSSLSISDDPTMPPIENLTQTTSGAILPLSMYNAEFGIAYSTQRLISGSDFKEIEVHPEYLRSIYAWNDTAFEPDWQTIENGLYAVRFYGVHSAANTLPDQAYMDTLASDTFDLSKTASAFISVPGTVLNDKMYTNYYIKAEYTGTSDLQYALFDAEGDGASRTEKHMPVKTEDDTQIAVMPLNELRKHTDGGIDLSCTLLSDFADAAKIRDGSIKLTVYGYDPFSLPKQEALHEIASAAGAFAQAEGTKESLSLEESTADRLYLMVEGAAGDYVKVQIEVRRDIRQPDGTKEKLPVISTEMKLPLLNGFGAGLVDWDDFDILLEQGDEITLGAGLGYRDGGVPNGGACKVTLYGYNEARPPFAEMTLLGEQEADLDLTGKACSVKVGGEQLYKTGFTDYYAVAEYAGEAADMQFEAVKSAIIEHTEWQDNGEDEPIPVIVQDRMESGENAFKKLHDGTAFLFLGRPEIGDHGEIEVTAAPYTGREAVKSGKVTLKIYGYNRYQMPDYADMQEVLCAASDYFTGKDSFTAETPEAAYWVQARHRTPLETDDAYELIVKRGTETVLQIPMTDFDMINGTRITKIIPAALGIKAGDVISIKRTGSSDEQRRADEKDGWQFAVYKEAPAKQFMAGDVNDDGCVDVSDAVLTARFLAEDQEAIISVSGLLAADVNRSGNPDAEDVTLILKYIACIISDFE